MVDQIKGRFKKGQVANPSGSSARARKLGEIKKLTIDQLAVVGTELVVNTQADLAEALSNQKASVLQIWLATLIDDSLKNRDARAFAILVDRIVGKPRETKVVSGPDGGPIEVDTRGETYQELAARAEALRQARLAVDEGQNDA